MDLVADHGPGPTRSAAGTPRRRCIVRLTTHEQDQVTTTIVVKRYSTMQLIYLLLLSSGMMVCLFAAWPRPAPVALLGLPLLIVVVSAAYRLHAAPRAVLIDTQRGRIELLYRRWTRKPPKILPLSQFPFVRSFERGGGGLFMVVVELASSDDLPRTVFLGVFDMDRAETTRFLEIPGVCEPAVAVALRRGLSSTGVIKDLGHLGRFLERRAEEVW